MKMKIENRQYQQNARYWCNTMLNDNRHPLLVMPTGTGKTKTAVQVIQDQFSLKKKILVFVPQDIIFQQWEKDFSEIIDYGYINNEGIVGKNKSVYLCMYQSTENMLSYIPEKFCNKFDIIITDETHHSSARSFRDIYNHFPQCLRMGLTATPYRFDNQPLGEFYTDMYEPITMSQAIEAGFLCRPVVYVPDEYKNHIPEKDGFDRQQQKEFIHEKKIIGDMVETYKNIFDGLPVIIPCSTHKHAKIVTGMYRGAGWKVEHIHSKLNSTDRKIIVNKIKNGKSNILITVGVGTEGMDIPGLFGIIWLRFTESLTIYMQFNGRPSRPAPDKNHYVMVDPIGVSVIHGRPDINRKWSLETNYKPGQHDSEGVTMKFCPFCDNANSTENIKCWICGYDFETGLLDGKPVNKKKRKLPKFIDGNLVFLDEYELRGKHEERRQDHADTNNICNGNGNNIDNNRKIAVLTKAEKIELLSKNITGLNSRTKFKDGLKWL